MSNEPLLLNPPPRPLAPSQRALINLRIQVHEQKLQELSYDAASLRTRLSFPQSQLSQLEDQLAEEESSIQGLKALLFPVSGLSKAVLCNIFSHAVEEGSQWDIRAKKHPARVLSQVCRRWRSVAVDSAALWTNITLVGVNPHPGEGSYKTSIPGEDKNIQYDRARWQRDIRLATECVQLWLRRSQDLPLNITFIMNLWHKGYDFAGSLDEESQTDLQALLDPLLSTRTRWSTARVTLCRQSRFYAPLLNPAPSESLPHLHALEISHRSLSDAPILSTPSLRRVSLLHWDHSWSVPATWATALTHLSIGEVANDFGNYCKVTGTEALSILAACPGLTHVYFWLDDQKIVEDRPEDDLFDDSSVQDELPQEEELPQDDPPNLVVSPMPVPTEVFTHPNLEQLKLNGLRGAHDFSNMILAPRLRSLAMYCDESLMSGRWADRDVALHAWIKRFGSQLKELRIEHMARNKESLKKVFTSCGGLEKLEVQAVPDIFTRENFRSLIPDPSATPGPTHLLPNLTHFKAKIECRGWNGDFDLGSVLEFIKRRRAGERPIQHVEVTSERWDGKRTEVEQLVGQVEQAGVSGLKVENVERWGPRVVYRV